MPIIKIVNISADDVTLKSFNGIKIRKGKTYVQKHTNDEIDLAVPELQRLQKVNLIRYIWETEASDILDVVPVTTAERLSMGGRGPRIVYDKDLNGLYGWNDLGFWEPLGGGGGSLLSLFSEGTFLGQISELDVRGVDVQTDYAAGRGTLYIPPQAYSPYFNSGSATVSNIGVNRRISAPTSEGVPFKIGAWAAGSTQIATNDSSPIWDTNSYFSILNNTTTTFTVDVYDADDVSLLTSHSITLSGNTDVTSGDIRIWVSDWTVEGPKFRARARVQLNLLNILSNTSGRFRIVITHDDDTDGTYVKAQTLFFDYETYTATITGVSIAENTVGSSMYLSGIRYYDIGDTFDIGIADLDYLNSDSYPTTEQVRVDPTLYGISTYSLSGPNLTAWTNSFDNVNASYLGTKAVDITNYRYIGPAAFVRGRIYDWSEVGNTVSPNSTVCVDTYAPESNELAEYFTDEVFRRTSADAAWDSTQHLFGYDDTRGLLVQGGLVQTPRSDWAAYAPGLLANPDYTGFAGWGSYYRRFTDVTSSVRGNATINISGFTLNDLITERIRMWIRIPGRLGDPNWCFVHGAAEFNSATFDGDNDPLREASSTANTIYISFGTLGLIPANNYFIMYIEIQDPTLQPTSIIINW